MRSLFLLLLLATGMGMSSCNRSWVCECSTTNDVISIELKQMNHTEATDECEKYSLNQYATTGGCKLR